jgi:hypothetical protein
MSVEEFLTKCQPSEVIALVAIAAALVGAGGLLLVALAGLRTWSKVREQQAELAKQLAELAPPPTDEAAARALGQCLRASWASAQAKAEVIAAFWAAEPATRRVFAHLLAGLCPSGAGDEQLLAVVRSLRGTSAARPEPGSAQK